MSVWLIEASVDRDRRQLGPRFQLSDQFNFNIFIPATGTTQEKQLFKQGSSLKYLADKCHREFCMCACIKRQLYQDGGYQWSNKRVVRGSRHGSLHY